MGKRLADVAGATALLVLATPVILLGAIVSFASYRRWPFFTQTRVGRHEEPFRLVKVRTLAPSTPSNLPKAHLEDHRPGLCCRFLRAHHLDELPQLIHVLRGTMSLVGPRPEMEELHQTFPASFAQRRTSVRPGITGLWQVSRAVEGMIGDHPEYDLFYVDHVGVRLDLWILWRTLAGLFGGSVIESLDEVPRWAKPRPADVDRSADGVHV